MHQKIKISKATEAIFEMAKEEFVKKIQLKELKGIFEEMSYGTIEIDVVDGEIENIRVTRNYKPIALVDEEEKIV
jgi:hypothetical protein